MIEIPANSTTQREDEVTQKILADIEEKGYSQRSCFGDKMLAEKVGRAFSKKGYYVFLMFYEPKLRFQYLAVYKNAKNVSTGSMSWIKEL